MAAVCAAAFFMASAQADVPAAARNADVVILGERHNTPEHQAYQAQALRDLRPATVVFEMLTPFEARRIPALIATGELRSELAAGRFHWGDLIDYADVLEAAMPARIVGAALPRDQLRDVVTQKTTAADAFGPKAGAYGLTDPLPASEQAAREDAQFEGHCQMMPREMMGGMVSAQRLRDAHFARLVIDAHAAHGGPVVLITGWGHARRDRGAPPVIARVAPGLDVFVISLTEDAANAPLFDHHVVTQPETGRPDPCDAFR